MRSLRILSISAILLASVALPAHAEWPADGDTLYGSTHGMFGPPMSLATDDAGVVAWWGHAANGSPILRSQRVTAAGEVLPNWDTNPPFLPNTAAGAADGLGGLFRSFQYRTGSGSGCLSSDTTVVYVQHVLTGGGLDPAWGSNTGVRVTSSTLYASLLPVTATADGAGGAIVAYVFVRCANGLTDLLVKRILASGAIAPAFPALGMLVNDPSWQRIDYAPLIGPDGAGGAYIAFLSTYAGVTDPKVVRVNGSGGFPSPWAAGGVEFTGDGTGTNPALIGLFPSSGGAELLCWSDQAGGVTRAWLQRFEPDGSVSAGWPGGGLLITSAATLSNPTVSTDGLGGAVFASVDGSNVARGVRVLPSGAIAPGWGGSGVPLLDAGAVRAGGPMLAPGSEGATIVCWTDHRRPGHYLVRARWLLGDGTPDPAVSDSGLIVCPEAVVDADLEGVASDGAGGAYVGWQNTVYLGSEYYVMMSHVAHPTATGIPPGAYATALSLAAPWPNPARDALNVRLSLPTGAPARLELLDLAGRRLRLRIIEGAGERVERFEGLGDLASSVYIVRVTQGTSVRAARVALIH